MKYRIKSVRSQGKQIIEFANGFDYGIFCEYKQRALVPYEKKERKGFLWLERIRQRLGGLFEALAARLRKRLYRLRTKREDPLVLPALCGALCASLCVMLIAFGAVVYKLFVSDYFGGYETVLVPDFSKDIYPDGESFRYADYCNLTVKHEYSDEYPEGTVISQTPAAGTERRLYKDRSNCNVQITVSLGTKKYRVPSLCGISQRDAVLTLKNSGIAYSVSEEYSDEHPRGSVISTDPPENTLCDNSAPVVLRISLGKKTVFLSAPSLVGLSEARAVEIVKGLGLSLGEITYSASDSPCGTVISQSIKQGEKVALGTPISFTVSAGSSFAEKRIPDLYGATVEEARQKLADVGLILGNIYTVSGSSKSSTVVAQFPVCGAEITPDVWSVDIYVNS